MKKCQWDRNFTERIRYKQIIDRVTQVLITTDAHWTTSV